MNYISSVEFTLAKMSVLTGTIYGTVEPYPYPYQDSYKYLEGVNVSIVETGDWDISTWYGKFEIYSDTVVSGNVYTVRAVKRGYITQERRVNITLGYGVTSVTFWMVGW